MTDLDFADDIDLLPNTKSQLKDLTMALEAEASKISEDKTKLTQVGNVQDNTPITMGGQPLNLVGQFNYLGSIMDIDGGTEGDVKWVKQLWSSNKWFQYGPCLL